MSFARVSPIAFFALVACGVADDSATRGLPYKTVIDTVGDTLVARTTGEVPDSALRHLVVEWRAGAGSEDEKTSFASIGEIAVGSDDRVYVWDPQGPSLRLYDAGGKLVKNIGRKGSGPGEYTRLNGMATLPDGRLVAWDAGNARINVYSAAGDPLDTWHPPLTGYFTNHAIAVDRASRIWARAYVPAADRSFGALGRTAWFRLNTRGVVADTVLQPLTERGDAPLVARSGGNTSSQDVPYGRAQTFSVSPYGALVWGPMDPYRVHAATPAGRPMRIERMWKPVPIADEERAQLRAEAEWDMRHTDPSWTWQGSGVPAVKPAYTSLSVGLDGRIWVSVSVASEAFEPAPPSPELKNPPPQVRFRGGEPRWDVFERDGRYLGRVAVPSAISMFVMRGSRVWGVMRDADDVPSLVKLHVQPPF